MRCLRIAADPKRGSKARRLSPESNPIEIADLPEERDEETLLYAMGSEAANVHLGSKRQVANILREPAAQKIKLLSISKEQVVRPQVMSVLKEIAKLAPATRR